ncbi:hypothetical protein FSW04_02100 [Baekduia soli]|uniref:Fur family transcriptional regulator n=1 Tax=Baekduia soli TaxID=496014 RepID=A0A5B8U0J1_9ACTN|nr:hypothetical protein [Baekduia soli]QEC46488.1 hypothetical protein FSW04_02100 [Baekduia soli]
MTILAPDPAPDARPGLRGTPLRGDLAEDDTRRLRRAVVSVARQGPFLLSELRRHVRAQGICASRADVLAVLDEMVRLGYLRRT